MIQDKEEYKQKTIRTWLEGSQDAASAAQSLCDSKHFLFCLFMCHLSLEKQIKALFLQKTDDIPPFIHDLEKLLMKAGVELSANQKEDLQTFNTFCVKGRYEDYKQEMYHQATPEYTQVWLDKMHSYQKWLSTHF